MKKIARLSLITLVIAIILTVIGGKMISNASVNVGDIYDIFEGSIPVIENNAKFVKTSDVSLDGMTDVTELHAVTYQLNEFNTLVVFAEDCTVKFAPTEMDYLAVSLDCPENAENDTIIQTAVNDGCLYVKFNWKDEPAAKTSDTILKIGVPENYKGGYSINASNSNIKLSNIDSSMDTYFNLYECNMEAQTISGKDIVFEASGGSSSIDKITSSDGFTVTGISSSISVSQIEAAYTIVTANSSYLNFNNIVGSLTADVAMCSSDFSYLSVTGNINITASSGTTNIFIPHDAPVSLRHEESYARFKNSVVWSDGDEKNTDHRYVIDTNVKFGIVTLSEKE